MNRYLEPERLDVDPSSETAASEWKHWKKTFTNFVAGLPQDNLNDAAKLNLLVNFLSAKTYTYVADCESYVAAVDTLQELTFGQQMRYSPGIALLQGDRRKTRLWTIISKCSSL